MRSLQQAVVGLLALGAMGCLVQIDHVRDPRPAFRQAREEAQRYAGRPGPAQELNVLVYSADEGELVRVSLPMWLVRKIDRRVSINSDFDVDFDRHPRVKDRIRRHVRLEDLEKAGLGILVEVEQDGGEQVLVWLR